MTAPHIYYRNNPFIRVLKYPDKVIVQDKVKDEEITFTRNFKKAFQLAFMRNKKYMNNGTHKPRKCDKKDLNNNWEITKTQYQKNSSTTDKPVVTVVKSRARRSREPIPMDFISLLPPKLFNGFQLQGIFTLVKKAGIDYKTIDYWSLFDSQLTYGENKEILREHLGLNSLGDDEEKYYQQYRQEYYQKEEVI